MTWDIRRWVDDSVETIRQSKNVRTDRRRLDAGETMAIQRQIEHLMTELFDIEYPEHKARRFFPVDNSTPTGAKVTTYLQYDRLGKAKIVHNYATDFPSVSGQVADFAHKIVSIGCSFDYSLQDIRTAAFMGLPLDPMLADTARNTIEDTIDELAATGNADAGISGFLNHASIPSVKVAVGTWSGATADEIISDVQKLWQSIPTATKQRHMPNTLLVPTTLWQYLQIPRNTASDKTVAKWLLENLENCQGIDQWWRLDTAGSGSVARLMAYEKSPRTGRIEIPQEYEQLAMQEVNAVFHTPCHARCGGAKIPYPLAYAYMDGC